MASGNSTPVRTTKNNEMPSTPKNHEMPRSLIHVCCETNWNSAEPFSKPASIHTLIAPVASEKSSEMSLTRSGRRLLKNAKKTAPTEGTTMSDGKIGNV